MTTRYVSAAALSASPPEVGRCATIRVPASTANLGPGFDSIGMALGVWDEAAAQVTDQGLNIEAYGHGSGEVPLDASHLVYRAMVETWSGLGLTAPTGLRLEYTGGIPHSRGMGSSASALVGGAALAVVLAGLDLADPRVLAYVNDVASCFEGHPDNASASVYGNATVSWPLDESGAAWRTAVLRLDGSIEPVLIVPATRLATSTARAALPEAVPLGVAARNSGRAALLVHALTSEPGLLMDATVDLLHQEARRPAYPDAMALVDALRAEGIPAAISGAGPTVLALATASQRSRVDLIAQGLEVLSPGVPTQGVHAVS